MAKYDWIKLKREYMKSKCKSVKAFLETAGIPCSGRTRNSTRGWSTEKRQNEERTSSEIIEKTLAKTVELESNRNLRHLEVYDLALDACEEILRRELRQGVDMFGNKYKSPVIIHSKLARIVEALEKIQKGHRLAEGLDGDSGAADGDVHITINPVSRSLEVDDERDPGD